MTCLSCDYLPVLEEWNCPIVFQLFILFRARVKTDLTRSNTILITEIMATCLIKEYRPCLFIFYLLMVQNLINSYTSLFTGSIYSSHVSHPEVSIFL
jgi:hypothetical protein